MPVSRDMAIFVLTMTTTTTQPITLPLVHVRGVIIGDDEAILQRRSPCVPEVSHTQMYSKVYEIHPSCIV